MFGRAEKGGTEENSRFNRVAAQANGQARGEATASPEKVARARVFIEPVVRDRIDESVARRTPRRELAKNIQLIVAEFRNDGRADLNLVEVRDLVTQLINSMLATGLEAQDTGMPTLGGEPAAAPEAPQIATVSDPAPAAPIDQAMPSEVPDVAAAPADTGEVEVDKTLDDIFVQKEQVACDASPVSATVQEAKEAVQKTLIERIDMGAASQLPRSELAQQITEVVAEICTERAIRLNLTEQRDLVTLLINDMLGLGPLEPLLADESVTDIMVNGAYQVYVERRGKLELSNVRFKDNQHVQNIATRIVTQIGRRIDESSPLCDARLADGSRVNIIIPPLAIDGPSISIRKFSKKSITLDVMASQANISPEMATVLKVASRSQLNILISGGTGSGKTTLLNAMSQLIDHGERIVTIEDAAELQLQQPHVVRLETRPANLEGAGEITMRDLVKNSLRMRPDRIILGEVRGSEAVDMLQAMNTGHEGSMCTVHANRPREALTRLENMVGMAGINLPSKAVRTQIAAAVDVIVQVSRMRDGVRRVTSVTEIVGMEGDVITTQELFKYEFEGEDNAGKLIGSFKSGGLRPHFTPKAEYFGLGRALLEAI